MQHKNHVHHRLRVTEGRVIAKITGDRGKGGGAAAAAAAAADPRSGRLSLTIEWSISGLESGQDQ